MNFPDTQDMGDRAYFMEASTKTRNLGLAMSLILVPLLFGFMCLDSITPPLHGIFWWRIGALVPAVLFLVYALFLFPSRQRLAIPFHTVQLAGLIIMMAGISADLATRPDFPPFGKTALISSLIICIFADFAFAAGARKYLPAILLPPLALMSIHIATAPSLTQMEKLWLISNPTAMALVLSFLALFQEKSSAKEFRVRAELSRAENARKRLEADREAALKRLEFVIATTRTGFDIIDEDYVVQYVDPARQKVMGNPKGRVCYEYFRGRSTLCDDCAMQKALKTHTIQVLEQMLPHENNRPTQITALPYQDDSGKWLVAEVIVDISERKKAEAERLDLERRVAASQKLEGLGILAGGVAHNFNNLLTIILGHADLLKAEVSGNPATSSVLEIIKASGRSRELVSQLLSLGRQQVLKLRPLDLNLVVRECGTILRQALRENITIDYRLSSSPCPVAADPGRIEQILLNLASNAQDAIPREGRIEIATTEVVLGGAATRRREDLPPGRYIRLTFDDTGEGMAAETLGKIFTPFFTTKEQGKGTGLGLFSAYGLVKQHNGTIEVESNPHAGTRFTIYFPRIEAPLEEARPSLPVPASSGTETVLLVEDEAPIRMMLSQHLRSLGYNILEAPDGASALQVFSEYGKEVHVLVTDVVMPRMNGTDLHDRLRERLPELKALFMSGYPKEVVSTYIKRSQEMELILKPFTGEALAERVREILDRAP